MTIIDHMPREVQGALAQLPDGGTPLTVEEIEDLVTVFRVALKRAYGRKETPTMAARKDGQGELGHDASVAYWRGVNKRAARSACSARPRSRRPKEVSAMFRTYPLRL